MKASLILSFTCSTEYSEVFPISENRSVDKKDKMVRNFSGILNNDLPKQKNEFNYDKELNLDNINNTNNKILSNRSMSQKII